VTQLHIGVIGLPGQWSSEALAQAIAQYTGHCPVMDMQDIWLNVENQSLYWGDTNLCEYDALLVKKIGGSYSPHALDRLELLRVAEATGVRVFSPALNILRLIDRLSCTVTLSNHQIPMPPTCITEKIDVALSAIERFGSVVLKPLYSTKARGMEVMHASDAIEQQRHQLAAFQQQNPMMYIQKKLELSGRDVGMVFLGGEYLGAYARIAQNNSWNTTIHSGGRYANFDAHQAWIDLAYRAQAPFNMDFTTVDVAESEDGPIVFEVSAFGGFRGAKEGIGMDAAAAYAAYAIQQLS